MPKILTLFFLVVFVLQLVGLIFLLVLPGQVQAASQNSRKLAAVNSSMPNWTMPDLKIEIPDFKKFSTPEECGKDSQGNKQYCIPWIGEYIAAVYKYAIGIVGILAAVVLMWGGVIWLTAGGSAERIGDAKSWIAASLSGLVLALCSYMIFYMVNPDLTSFKPLKITMVKLLEPAEAECDGCVYLTSYGFNFNSNPCEGGASNCQIHQNLINNLTQLKNSSSVNWRITEAYPPTVTHSSTCHYDGTCLDIGLTSFTNCDDVNKLIQDAKNAGFKVLNEYSACGGTTYTTTTGGCLHISI